MNISKCKAQSSLLTVPSNLEMISDTGRISWGERATITLRLGLELGDNSTGWPVWEDTIPGGLEILSTSKIDTILPQKNDPSQWDMIVLQSWVSLSGLEGTLWLSLQHPETIEVSSQSSKSKIIEPPISSSETMRISLPFNSPKAIPAGSGPRERDAKSPEEYVLFNEFA